MTGGHVLAIDQGTTSTRAMVFGPGLEVLATAQREFEQLYPRPGWVEHDPELLWSTTLETAREALARAGLDGAGLAGIGVTNQRETAVVWDRATGRAIHNAIVWQDRRTIARACEALARRRGMARMRQSSCTGLRLDPYFSATKIAWLLDNIRRRPHPAPRPGELAFGTVDSFLLWRLTEGRVHATDATNASRTLLCDLAGRPQCRTMGPEMLLDLFGIPAQP